MYIHLLVWKPAFFGRKFYLNSKLQYWTVILNIREKQEFYEEDDICESKSPTSRSTIDLMANEAIIYQNRFPARKAP